MAQTFKMDHACLPGRGVTMLRSMPITITLALLLAATAAAPAKATSYRHFLNREIVREAELVVEGTITAIIGPPEIKGNKKPGASIAVVRVGQVFRGHVKAGEEIRFVFWSRQGSPKSEWRSPDEYKVGEKLMLALREHDPDRWEQYTTPKEAAGIAWSGWSPRAIYDSQIQSEEFRKVAEIWRDPEKHLRDPKRRNDAAYFMALQFRMTEKHLVRLLESGDITERHAGCLAAEIIKSNAALAPLVAIIEEISPLFRTDWNDRPEEEQKRLQPLADLCASAGRALHETPFDGTKDGPALLRLARCGGMGDHETQRLLRACPARWHVARGLGEDALTKANPSTLHLLHALDERAAYEPLRKLATADKGRTFATLTNRYQTVWAQRFVLENAAQMGYGADQHFNIVRNSFGFSHQSVDPYERRKGAGTNNTWENLYAELRKNAMEQLEITRTKGPSFAELPKRLGRVKQWESRRVGASSYQVLTKEQHEKLSALLVRHADVHAAELNARTEAAWIVDLYDEYFDRSLPVGQLWVAADGAFGFGWLPDRAWGKSEKIVALLEGADKQTKAPEGFEPIFNGKDLTGWAGSDKYWKVEDGALTGVADGKLDYNRFIVWKKGKLKNFELRVKVYVTPKGNSGINYRSTERPDLGETVVTGYQCDVVANRADYNGMLYEERGRRILAHTGEKVIIDAKGQSWVIGEFPLKEFKAGEWHDFRILVRGNHHQHWIDGHQTVDVIDLDEKGRKLEGVLALQVHVGPAMKIQYKDVFLKRLPDDIALVSPEMAKIPESAVKVVPQGKDKPKTPKER
jgi:hypothetical protein